MIALTSVGTVLGLVLSALAYATFLAWAGWRTILAVASTMSGWCWRGQNCRTWWFLPISTAQRTADFSLIHVTLFFRAAPRHMTKLVALNVVLAWRCLSS